MPFLLGSGGGWNQTYSLANNFTAAMSSLMIENEDVQPTGFNMALSWMGGIRCSNRSHQYGGAGGGGAGCHGGGGGGGFIGKKMALYDIIQSFFG